MAIRSLFHRPPLIGIPLMLAAAAFASGVPVIGERYPVQGFGFRESLGSRTHSAAAMLPSGRIVASESGLVELDGSEWRRLMGTDNRNWQSLVVDGTGRIWAGAGNEIGVFEPDAAGALKYRPLAELLPPENRQLGDVWGVHLTEFGTVFVGVGRVVVTDGRLALSWEIPSERRLFSWTDGGSLYVGAAEGRVFQMTGVGPREVPRTLGLLASEIPWAEGLEGDAWIALTESGIQSADGQGGGFFREVNKVLKKSAPVAAVRIADGRLAIGTYFGGLILVDTKTGAFDQVRMEEGLVSSNVTGLIPSGRDDLWVVTTRGVSRVSTSGAVSVFRNSSGMEGGSVHFVERSGDTVIVATDSGRFELPPAGSSNEIERIDNLWIYDQARIGTTTLGGSLGGLHKLSSGRFIRLNSEKDDVSMIVASPNRDDVAFYAAGPVLRAALVRDGGVEILASETFAAPIDDMVAGVDGELWVSAAGAISRIEHRGNEGRLVVLETIRVDGGREAPSGRIRLARIGDAMFATRGGALFGIDGRAGVVAPLPGFSGVEIVDLASTSTGSAWALARPISHGGESPRLIRLRLGPTGIEAEVMHASGLLTSGELRSLHTVDRGPSGPELWIGAQEAVLRVDVARLEVALATPRAEIRMSQTVDGASNDVPSTVARFAHGSGPVTFHWSIPGAVPGDAFLETRLVGAEADWKPAGDRFVREFSGLGDGEYVFQARALDALGRPGPVVERSFAVLPPWYLSLPALSGFGLIVLVVSWLGWNLRMRAVRRRGAQLEKLVDERTRELARVSAEKTRFIARMNHEIRNPLNGLLGTIGILEQTPHTGREGRLIQILRTCADHLGAVVEDVLDFANIEGGRIVVQERAYSIETLIASVPTMMLAEAERTGTEISTSVSADVPGFVVGDPDRIRQILINFLGNALKFAPGEPVEIEAALTSVGSEQCLRFAVRDHGPGISEADKQLLFSMFERGKGAQKGRAKGMGIGLATCRLLARRMGGEVGVVSGLGEGSEFFLRLPLHVSALQVPLPTATPSFTSHLTCLVVEDQEFNRIILRDMLERHGCTVDEAVDAETAIRLSDANHYDAIFTDLELPDAAPGEILKLLELGRSSQNVRGPAFVVTTANATENVRQTCLAAGAVAFLAKPLSAGKVADVLREIEAARRPAESVAIKSVPSSGERGEGALFYLARIRGCEVSVIAAEVAGSIGDECRKVMENVRLANPRDVAHHAHRLLSLAGMSGCPELAGVVGAIQTEARAGRLPKTGVIEELIRAVSATGDRLASIKNGASAAEQTRAPRRSGPAASSHSN